jgi:hypothetical protein
MGRTGRNSTRRRRGAIVGSSHNGGDLAMAFYEIRQYKIHPGRMDEWVRIMEEEIVPFQVSKGMVICGLFRHETDESVWFWIRRFESEAQREQQYKDVYESDYWKTKIAPKAPEYVVRGGNIISRVVPTPRSPMQ